jgi:hypothetical protein
VEGVGYELYMDGFISRFIWWPAHYRTVKKVVKECQGALTEDTKMEMG